MGEYIPPTTKDVRRRFGTLGYDESFFEEEAVEFDVWLSKHDAEVRKQVIEEIARTLSLKTEGLDRAGTSPWPERHRQIYSLAIEEAVTALLTEAREIGDR